MSNALILAGGQGKRLHSDLPKTMCEVAGKPIISWITDAFKEAGIENICIVTGYAKEYLEKYAEGRFETVYQSERLGTGHAVMTAENWLREHIDEPTLIFNGDAPFVDSGTITDSLKFHLDNKNAATVLSAEVPEPFGYGRIIRDERGVLAIREQKDCSEAEKNIREINSGCFWFDTRELLPALKKLTRNNAQGEYYLTDAVEILRSEGKRVDAFTAPGSDIVLSANDRKGMLELNEIAKRKILEKHLDNGVEIVCADGIIISPDVKIEPGAKILPGCILRGNTVIGKNAVIGPNCQLSDTKVGEGSVLNNVYSVGAAVGNGCRIGPFVQLRPGTKVDDLVHIGDFVEIKNSNIGKGTSVSHFNYVGDSDVGKNVNFGCGSLTANYDGTNKFRTEIGDNAFIGCNTNLVAPVKVGEAAYTAAGSTVTHDVPDRALVIERGEQKIREGYAEKKLARHLEKGRKLD